MDFRSFICGALKLPVQSTAVPPIRCRQTIQLEKALNQQIQKRQDLKKVLIQTLANLRTLILDRGSIMTQDWQPICQETENLGLGDITCFIEGLIVLKTQPEYLGCLDVDLLHQNLNGCLDQLDETIRNLDSYGFFEDKDDSADSNLLENKNVLIAEDMPYNRILLKKILQRLNCITSEAENGKEAVEQWTQNSSFDLIVMDMNMPVMDGFEATHAIRQYEAENALKRTPIIAVTALAMRGDRERCLDAGCDEYITKPVVANLLINICQQLLSGVEAQSEPAEVQRTIDIQKVLLKTDNQVYEYILKSILGSHGIVFDQLDSLVDIQISLLEDRYDFVILEAAVDLALAYFIKTHFPDKYVILITTKEHDSSIFSAKSENNILYPFDRDQISAVLNHCFHMQQLARKRAESIADADSLGRIKGRASIKEAVQKSNQQLAVWQKAFRKIGGDLVLSHEFNFHGKYGFILGDVSGHDIQSGYTASWFAGLVKGVWGQYSNPYDLLCNLNSFFDHDADEEDKRFVCALILLWDPLRHKLYYANAGIPGGILVEKKTGQTTLIKWTGMPIGLFPEMDMFDHAEIDFLPGDRLYIATDGVLEAIPSEIISGIGESKSNQPPQQALDSIVDFVKRSIEVTDDLTIAVFEGHNFDEPQRGFRKTIKSTSAEIETVLKYIEQYINEHDLNKFGGGKISVAVREALINALEHGNGNVEEKSIDIDLEIFNNTIQVRVSDSGGGFDLNSEKKRLKEEGELRIHGRGIDMMETICQSVSFNGGGVCLEFVETD
ncbi:MAG: SpoIIE family protein phosphatase [Deltaproteobacteria bacterium]|nr:SpoIIE family protein phosphatase [Deltaproteobacteria bacterium]